MDTWKLPLDVLLHIISLARIKTKSRMVKTCRILHREGGKTLLRSCGVLLCTRNQIVSFLFFMRADPPGRFPSLRSFHLRAAEGLPMESEILLAGFFTELAERHSGLRTLRIHGYNLTGECSNDELARAVSRLRSITDLKLDFVSHSAWSIMRTAMLSRLVKADISVQDPVPFPESRTLVDIDLTHLLEGSCDTLQSFSFVGSHLNRIVTSRGPVYHRLQTLYHKAGEWLPEISHYITAFPALKSLSVAQEDSFLYAEGYASLRDVNQHYQHAHGSWPSLDYFWGTTQHLHALSLTCHVAHILLDDIDEEVHAEMLGAVLDDVRPVRVELASYALSNFRDLDWTGALCAQREPPMQFLKITMRLMGNEDDTLGEAIDAICAALASTSLRAFQLDIQCVGRPLMSYGRIEVMDLQTTAQSFQDACPSLEAVLIESDYFPDEKHRKARIGSASRCRRLLGPNGRV
ncbi:hypothetical protein L226DRAFT_538946 [Lentinus tigrinus ALCF2SS1-7]|uniref:F-box domain-containing protein n=1 Tax=Lentinus tigrinus ALCF2SS1-6 TaxID=1328759 RepID=A0A5C2RTX8_9APHY|nr:hypothetical protein L227DRAFT_579973 [Lentinus tigrinus ALCF2SS1-6]RPD70299.1 hypothetical protein L226DRAFT_538946 [Lentinus tigrinus ALCF2SS1-7]